MKTITLPCGSPHASTDPAPAKQILDNGGDLVESGGIRHFREFRGCGNHDPPFFAVSSPLSSISLFLGRSPGESRCLMRASATSADARVALSRQQRCEVGKKTPCRDEFPLKSEQHRATRKVSTSRKLLTGFVRAQNVFATDSAAST